MMIMLLLKCSVSTHHRAFTPAYAPQKEQVHIWHPGTWNPDFPLYSFGPNHNLIHSFTVYSYFHLFLFLLFFFFFFFYTFVSPPLLPSHTHYVIPCPSSSNSWKAPAGYGTFSVSSRCAPDSMSFPLLVEKSNMSVKVFFLDLLLQ